VYYSPYILFVYIPWNRSGSFDGPILTFDGFLARDHPYISHLSIGPVIDPLHPHIDSNLSTDSVNAAAMYCGDGLGWSLHQNILSGAVQ
jgi:hypothetical protein